MAALAGKQMRHSHLSDMAQQQRIHELNRLKYRSLHQDSHAWLKRRHRARNIHRILNRPTVTNRNSPNTLSLVLCHLQTSTK